MLFILQTVTDASGQSVPIWRMFWALFGASNQLLAAITLLGVTVWLWRTRRATWIWFVTGIPMVLMSTMSIWALVIMIKSHFEHGLTTNPVPWIALLLVCLAVMMIWEGIQVVTGRRFVGPVAPVVDLSSEQAS
jgi:carbon starvation protein